MVSNIPEDAVECPEDEDCPCGRGLPYGECCKQKGIKWRLKGDTFFKSYVARLPQEGLDGLDEQSRKFSRLFGREVVDEDLVLFDLPAHDNEFFRKGMTFLRNCGLPKEWIYAYYKTDGLMPTTNNEDYLSQDDLELFEDFCHEYTELMNAGVQKGSTNILYLVSVSNEIFETMCDTVLIDMISGLEYFLNSVSTKKGAIVAPPNSLNEYAIFIAMRSIKAIKSIRMLGVSYETESIYSIGRSLFECYIYLKNINNDPSFFTSEIFPVLSSHDYGFEINDGQINYKRMRISKALNDIGRKRTRNLYQLNNCCGPDLDKELYDYYYRPACQFVHIDAFTARSCFYEADLYEEFDSSLVAIICVLSTAILVVDQLIRLSIVPDRQAKDLRYLVANCAYKICDCLMMLIVDPEQKEHEYECMLQRVKLVDGNEWSHDREV